jgi:hypothetical protein
MKAKIITYSVKHLSIPKQNQLRKGLNGHTDRSHGGKYKYRREGLLDKIKHIKPNRSTVIAPIKEANQIIKLLEQYSAKILSYDIQIAKREFK